MNNSAEYYQCAREELAFLLPEQYSKVLEVGCGRGMFRKNLDKDHEYWGVEPVESVGKLALDKLDNVLIGTYQEVEDKIPDNYFDLVICNDVIEHLPDHDEFFQSIKKKMNQNGSLVASIPNVRYIWNLLELLIKKDWEYKNEGILDTTHLRFFTKKSLVRTLANHSFSIEQIAGINYYKPKSILTRVIYGCSSLLFGQDTKYLQFGVRIKDQCNRGIQLLSLGLISYSEYWTQQICAVTLA